MLGPLPIAAVGRVDVDALGAQVRAMILGIIQRALVDRLVAEPMRSDTERASASSSRMFPRNRH